MERLKKLRESENKTQLQVAEIIGVPLTTYNNYEKSRCEPNIDTLIKLADLFGVSIDFLVERQFSNEVGFLTKEQSEFVKAYLALNEYDQAFIYGQVAGLLAKY